MRQLRRMPGQCLTHTAVPEFPIPAPAPLLPYIATEPPPYPGVHFLQRRWDFCKPKIGVPPFERAPQVLCNLCERDASRPERLVASLILELLEGFLTHPAPVGTLACEAEPQERPLPGAGHRPPGFVYPPLGLPGEEPPPTCQHLPPASCTFHIDGASVRVAHQAGASSRKLLIQPVQQQRRQPRC